MKTLWVPAETKLQASFERVYMLGRCLTLRKDWEEMKLQVMLEARVRDFTAPLQGLLLGPLAGL